MSTWLGIPPLFTRSLARWPRPSSRLLPPVSKKRLTAAGLLRLLVGDIASVSRLMTNWPRLMSCGDRSLWLIQLCSSLRQAR
ncbi:Uncharacterised protein [Klebsiella pneumoniae]|nr:Uncharacterised protein [Klebsiella pneumoniae]